jgi:hypothetical protein
MKKSLISIAALGFLSIPALASSTTQTAQIISPALSAELSRLGNLLGQRKLVDNDFVDVRPMIETWVKTLDLLDPTGASEHGVITEQLENLAAIGADEKYKMIIDDFGDFRQSLIATALVSKVRVYRDAVLAGKAASIQPITSGIAERVQNALPKDPNSAKDAAIATQIANDLAKRVKGTPSKAKKVDFNFFIEVINGQRMVQFTGVTMARRATTGLVSPVDFNHAKKLITARNAAEIQLYRDAGIETQRLNSAVAEVQASLMAKAKAAPLKWLAAISVDMNLRRSMKYLSQKGSKNVQSVSQFNRISDLLAIRATGPLGNSNMGRQLGGAIAKELATIKQVAAKRALTAADFRTFERLRGQLMTNATSASFNK